MKGFFNYIKYYIDKALFRSFRRQIIVFLALFMVLVCIVAGIYNKSNLRYNKNINTQNKTDSMHKMPNQNNKKSYFDNGYYWALIHATDPGYLGDDIETFDPKHNPMPIYLAIFITFAGWFILSGFIMTIFINYYQSHSDRIKQGLVRYYFYNFHSLMLGWNNLGVGILRQLLYEEKGKIVILSLTPSEEIINSI